MEKKSGRFLVGVYDIYFVNNTACKFMTNKNKIVKQYKYLVKTGRPTKYTPQIIEELNKYLEEAIPQNMKIPTVEGIALKLGISKKTLYSWAKEHEEFLNALEELKMKQKESLTEIGIFGGKEINATIVALLLKVNHNMIESPNTAVQINFNQTLGNERKEFDI